MREIVLCVAAGMLVCCGKLCEGKSVFAIASHGNGKVKAYEINGNNIDYQGTIGETENFGGGAGGLCLWPLVDRMFVTYEGSTIITWASIKNLRRNPQTDEYATDITGGNGLGGMAVDGSLYVISRNTSRLYAFAYDTYENTLIPVPLDAGHVYRELEDVTTGIDIAIDETGSSIMGFPVGRLYVSDLSETVRYYNMATWQKEGSVTLGRSAIGIGLDKTRGYLYGGYFPGGGGSNYLMRYDLDGDPNDSETYLEQDLGAPVMDIAVDEDTGYLYLTLKRLHDGLTGIVEVYDPTDWISTDENSLVLLDTESDSDFVSEGPGGIAVGPAYKPPRIFVEKVDDVNELSESVLPDDEITYSIVVRPGVMDEPNVVVTDFLPAGVDFVSADPNDGYYDADAHAYVWEVGYLPGYDPNDPSDPNVYLALTVQVNELAEPAADLINILQTESDGAYTEVTAPTPVGCWGGNVIYVDKYAPGPHIGTTWETAYLNLTDALARAESGCGTIIRVADGTYKPGNDPSEDYFDVPDRTVGYGVEIYGGYAGYGATDPNERNWKRYKTILSGYISDTSRNETIITMGNNSLLDGFTVEESGLQGILANESSFEIINCIIKEHVQRGLYCTDSNATVQWCEIFGNGTSGLRHIGESYLLTVENCQIYGNQQDGIYVNQSTSQIKNSVIYQNGLEIGPYNYYGINLLNPSSSPDIHNNTIVDNINEGIRFVGSNTPDIRNCIVYYNGGDTQLAGLDPDTDADHCCIQDCNEIPTNFNFNDTPDFVYDYEPFGYYHIKYESECRNTGDNNAVETGDVDMDNTERKQENIVDVGADEVSCEDTWHDNDWTYDGVINMEEFAIFSAAWLSHDPNDPVCDPNNQGYVSDPNDPDYISQSAKDNWNPICNLEASGSSEYAIDLGELASFCENWLWEACWRENYIAVMYGMSGGGSESMMMAAPPLMSTLAAYEPQPVPEKSIAERILDLEVCIELLEKIWLEDPYIQQVIDPDDWDRFMDAVYDGLDELKTGSVPIDIK